MFEAYVTNPGLYPELGVEAGETLRFPTTTEEVRALFSRIGIDGERYGEYFITSYDSDVLGLYDCLDEYAGLDELNYLAHVLAEVQERGELEKFEAAMAFGEYTDGAGDLINLAQNLDCYDFYPGIGDDEALGCYCVEEIGSIDIPEHIRDYFDYEAYEYYPPWEPPVSRFRATRKWYFPPSEPPQHIVAAHIFDFTINLLIVILGELLMQYH